MLPGFRFLFAATFLAMSILVFGLGAAALLRAAHEQFASNPSWHAAPEATFTQQAEATRPVLAMLQVEAEQKAPGSAPAIDPAGIPAPAEPVSVAALKQDAPAPPAAAKPDLPGPENPAPSQMAAAPNDTPASDAPTLASTAQAAAEPVSQPANEATPAASEVDAAASSPASAPAAPEADKASTTIATLDNPSVTVEPKPLAKTVSAKPDQSAVRKRLRARRAAYRRRMAARAARQALLAAQQQQAANPFGQSFVQPQPAPATATTRGH